MRYWSRIPPLHSLRLWFHRLGFRSRERRIRFDLEIRRRLGRRRGDCGLRSQRIQCLLLSRRYRRRWRCDAAPCRWRRRSRWRGSCRPPTSQGPAGRSRTNIEKITSRGNVPNGFFRATAGKY